MLINIPEHNLKWKLTQTQNTNSGLLIHKHRSWCVNLILKKQRIRCTFKKVKVAHLSPSELLLASTSPMKQARNISKNRWGRLTFCQSQMNSNHSEVSLITFSTLETATKLECTATVIHVTLCLSLCSPACFPGYVSVSVLACVFSWLFVCQCAHLHFPGCVSVFHLPGSGRRKTHRHTHTQGNTLTSQLAHWQSDTQKTNRFSHQKNKKQQRRQTRQRLSVH